MVRAVSRNNNKGEGAILILFKTTYSWTVLLVDFLLFHRMVRYPPYDADKQKMLKRFAWIAVPSVKTGMGFGTISFTFLVVLIFALFFPTLYKLIVWCLHRMKYSAFIGDVIFWIHNLLVPSSNQRIRELRKSEPRGTEESQEVEDVSKESIVINFVIEFNNGWSHSL